MREFHNTLTGPNQLASKIISGNTVHLISIAANLTAGQVNFLLDNGSGPSPVTLLQSNGTSASSTSSSGIFFLLESISNEPGILTVQASNNFAGEAIVSIRQLGEENLDLVLLPSAARTAQVDTSDFFNPHWSGVQIFVNVSAGGGGLGIQPTVRLKDPASGNYVKNTLTGTKITTTGLFNYIYYPAPGVNVTSPLPYTWAFEMQVSDATPFTYSVGASLLR